LFQSIYDYLPHLTVFALVDTVLICTVIPIVLIKKREPTTAVAWCLMVLMVPVVGAILFWLFGYNYIHRRITRLRRHRSVFGSVFPPARMEAARGAGEADVPEGAPHSLADLALAVDAFPVSQPNRVTIYHETEHAYKALLEAIRAARHHIHLEYFIFRSDATGWALVNLLIEKAKAGVEVRLLYDSVGSLFISWRMLRALLRAGGQAIGFLPVNPLRSLFQLNFRNHRKITVIDGTVGFTGGMNIGDEYLGKDRYFGYWRDTFVRIEGPGVAALQRVFIEDWDFATRETLNQEPYFPHLEGQGQHAVQIVASGPDQDLNSTRELYFAAILEAKRRLWIASPYFVPDAAMLDALRLACLRGVDVRLLCLSRPDHNISFYAGRYYWSDVLAYGARIYTYTRGMMHSKIIVVDDDWALVGTANLDNRSLHLNFELSCVLFSPDLVADVVTRFERDLEDSVPLDPETFERRGLFVRLVENACRLFAPIL
jgi:cardiolipin synthase